MNIKKISLSVLICFLSQLVPSHMVWAKAHVIENVETIDSNIKVAIYSYKKRADFVAVEIGFTNQRDKYVAFSPKEIYLNDDKSYSVPPLPFNELQHIQSSHSNLPLIPLGLAIGLGIGAIGASDHADVAAGLAAAALGMGGVFVVSEALESTAKDNHFVAFQNNSLDTIDKLPPGVTLGGFLYFPKTKKPSSITIVTETSPGHFEKKVIPLRKKS